MTIEDRRRRIDDLDVQIVRLLNERASHALEIARLKRDSGAEVHQPEREEQVLQHVRGANPGPLPNDMLERLFLYIMSESKRFQRGE